ncbi:hypothetical protein BGX27_003201, partial [Mortierella sp. AM989]
MDFQGCFRLFRIHECPVPTSIHQLKDRLPKFLKSCLAFATLVMDEVNRRRSFVEVDEDSSEKMKLAMHKLKNAIQGSSKVFGMLHVGMYKKNIAQEHNRTLAMTIISGIK